MKDLKQYDVVRFDIIDKIFTSEGFATGGTTANDDEIELYENIDLESFPSFRDFTGNKTVVKHGYYGIVIKKIGRPDCLNQDEDKWAEYDVYEIFTHNLTRRHVFRFNLKKDF